MFISAVRNPRFIICMTLLMGCPGLKIQTVSGQAIDGLPAPRTAAEIASYPNSDPQHQPRVRLDAVVTYVDPVSVFIEDDSGATFLHHPKRREILMPGQRIIVEGRRHPGLFIGGILPGRIEMAGMAPLPRPKRIGRSELHSGRWHYHLVEVEGVVRAFQNTGESTGIMQINAPGGMIELRFDQVPDNPVQLIDASIRVTGLASGVINAQRQLITPYVRVRDATQMTVVEPAPQDPYAIPATPINQIPGNAAHRIKIQGQALGPIVAGGVFLRDSSGAILARMSNVPKVQTGDHLEVLGFVTVGVFNAQLRDAVGRVLSSGDPPLPNEVTSRDMYEGCDADLIQVSMKVLQRVDTSNQTELLGQHGPVALKIIARANLDEKIGAGAEIQATGLCLVTRTTSSSGHRAHPNAYDLFLREDKDLLLLSRTPWLTDERLTTLLSGVAILALLAILWAAILRLQISRQTRIIQDKLESEVVAEERRRIAREFHDTLEQELAGMSLRVDAAAARVDDGKAKRLLDELLKLLVRTQKETREFIWNLRDTTQTDINMPEAMRSMIEHLQNHTPVPITLQTTGEIKAPTPLAQHHLLSIAGEAIHNAVKYASAKSIRVYLAGGPDKIHLLIRDDGAGFDPDQVSAGHFGIQGMKERARKIGATLAVESESGKGTKVNVLYKN